MADPQATMDGQVAIVTGAARGLGFATATALAQLACSVVLVDRSAEQVTAAAELLRSSGHRASAFVADLTDEAAVGSMVGEVVRDQARIDVLVNLAGVFPPASIENMSFEHWKTVLAGNLDTTFLCCREVLPHMRQAGYGRIVNTSSGSVHLGMPDFAAYITAKMGVIGFTRCLAKTVGRYGITANVIMPGATDTEGTRQLAEVTARDAVEAATLVASLIDQQSVKRTGEPDDIASAIVFLASPAASFITGEVLNVGGGITFSGH